MPTAPNNSSTANVRYDIFNREIPVVPTMVVHLKICTRHGFRMRLPRWNSS